MVKPKYKFQLYKHLQMSIPQIYAEARKAADDLGIPAHLRGRIGLSRTLAGCPSPLRNDIAEAITKGNSQAIPLAKIVDEIREMVKAGYGDDWDAAPVNTCEAALWLCMDTLFTPPHLGRGDSYRACYILPYEKQLHHHGAYGRPFPPRYKDLFADRGTTAGEQGLQGKRLTNLDMVIVPLAGADYPVHGIKQHPVPFLTEVDPEEAIEQIALAAEVHGPHLSGFASLGYDTPGYGYNLKDEQGAAVLQKRIGEVAAEYGVPYLINNTAGMPFIGTDPRKVQADLIICAMEAVGAMNTGLIIGRESTMVTIRRALGMHSDRWGTTASFGKAGYDFVLPSKAALLAQAQALRMLHERPESVTGPVDQLEAIVQQEFAKLPPSLRQDIEISKSYNRGLIEINYEKTWKKASCGLPVFTVEDMYAGTNILQTGLAQMGIIPASACEGNIEIAPGLGTVDEQGQLLEEPMRYGVQALVQLIEIIARHSQLLPQ
ncbi:hypothetical protein [Heliophilum fasciatum]|uniref:Uncharacterized protein n=1 Tax=Heliophilum fasciatum TaxID=35700 RepID=A0A4R2RYR1_9FIRM|nr:hypothetical protein [Heliophilum fasciatum]MCW2277144.1 hypothetical protein [Heliophilum fasciatum]TCP68219.1 hypothetical protein EDD73_104122 [Heliophilum fasciatum]